MNAINGKKVIGMTAGAGIGAGIGVVAGSKLGEKTAKAYINNSVVSLDDYIGKRIAENIDRIHTLDRSEWSDTFQQINKKARQDYASVVDRLTRNTKTGAAAFCALALGVVGLFVANKVINKVEKSDQ